MYSTLIDTQTLAENLHDPAWVIVDCRFELADRGAGEKAYRRAHIPGAVYAHLERDLSGAPHTDEGRHPLPGPEALARTFGRLAIGSNTGSSLQQVVAYSGARGMMAARLWWLLRYMGHESVAVLEGGWPAWEGGGFPSRSGSEVKPASRFRGAPRTDWLVQLDEVAGARRLIDSRAPARYRGEFEPIDPIAGHIPGALNYYYGRNMDAAGAFLPAAELRRQFEAILQDSPANEAVFYCGSGVSACVNLLALKHAGLPDGRLYVGSWSEWTRDPRRPVATGAD